MKTSFYLVVNGKGSAKAVKTKPSLDWNEISIKLDLLLPDSLFSKPQLTANIEVKEDQVSPTQINAEMTENIKSAIEQHTGLPIKLTIVKQDEE